MNADAKNVIILALLAIPGTIALMVGMSALFAIPTYYLWNGLVPKLFNLTHITFLQAWGLNLLSGFLLGGRVSKK